MAGVSVPVTENIFDEMKTGVVSRTDEEPSRVLLIVNVIEKQMPGGWRTQERAVGGRKPERPKLWSFR